MTLSTPVLLIFFNRPETLRRVFEVVRKARPRRLLLAQDGPRSGGRDADKVQESREIVSTVDWECEVSTRYLDTNLGCSFGPPTAVDWALGLVERAIVLEDDCVPADSFFGFCDEMLDRYERDLRIGMVGGLNHFGTYDFGGASYGFVKSGAIWGWATWRDRWAQHDPSASAIRDQYLRDCLRADITPRWAADRRIRAWEEAARTALNPDSWDAQWGLTRHINSWLTVVPGTNQISNIGAGDGSTHFANGIPTSQRRLFGMETGGFARPLVHPDHIVPDRRYDELAYRILFPTGPERYVGALKARLRSLLAIGSG